MNSIGNIPFLRPALALASGIGVYLGVGPSVIGNAWWVLCLISALLLTSWLLGKWKIPSASAYSGLSALLTIFFLGSGLARFSQNAFQNSFFENHKPAYLKLILDDEVSDRARSWRSKALVISGFDSFGNEIKLNGNLLVYWPHSKNQSKPNFQYGDVFLIANSSVQLPGAAFPEDFDFKAAMQFKNVHHQVFLASGEWRKIAKEGSLLFRFAYFCRNAIVNRLHEVLPAKQAALMASLIIGYRAELDQSDMQAFAISGTTHVLAVSGLHVGLLYLLLVLVFTGKRNNGKLVRWQGLMVILLLWIFALITGLSASVVRSALMFTILEIGRSVIYKRGNLLNSLFASAFIQLLIDPVALMDVGFQLSYLAVLGIAIIHPHLNLLWVPKSRWLFYLYQSAMLSVAATIATLPLTLYYFHSFPVWFIPSNLWIVPLSTIAIVAGLFSLALGWIPFLGIAVAKITTWLCVLLSSSAHFFASLPFASVKHIFISRVEAGLMLCIVIFCLSFWILKSRGYLWFGMVSLFLFGLCGFWLSRFANRKEEIIICQLEKELLVVRRVGDNCDIYSRPISPTKADSISRHMEMYTLKCRSVRLIWHMREDSMVLRDTHGNGHFRLNAKGYEVIWSPFAPRDSSKSEIRIASSVYMLGPETVKTAEYIVPSAYIRL